MELGGCSGMVKEIFDKAKAFIETQTLYHNGIGEAGNGLREPARRSSLTV